VPPAPSGYGRLREDLVKKRTLGARGRGELVPLASGRVVLERDVRIPVGDGITLSADVFRPAAGPPVPAILEQVPYRKDDVTAVRDRRLGRALAERGFALVCLDVRGTGRSDGIAVDEYTEAEQEDGAEAVGWAAVQKWCSGAVGAYGVSYGGFAAIQLAMRRPPALGAIAAVYSTDDRYTDDVHFYGGALCALELVHYPLRMVAMNGLPPGGSLGERGREAWRARIDATPPWILRWLQEQRDGPYWRNGSLRPAYERIVCPTLLVGGWRDGYVNAAVRMAERLEAPWKLVVGPWPHVRPNIATVPPTMDLVGLLEAWFGRHLRGDAGPGQDETLVFVQDYDDPRRVPERISGAWRRVGAWPREEIRLRRLHLDGGGTLAAEPVSPVELEIENAPHAGTQIGVWCPPPPPHGLPGDQRPDEVHGLTFTTAPLEEEAVCLGFPRLRIAVSHPGPTALLSAKLADVAPDGCSQLVTRTVLNLSHRDGHPQPAPLPRSTWIPVELGLDATAWRFAPGHRIRLALASSDWPTVWPAPTSERLRVRVGDGEATLELPLAPAGEPADVPPAPEPEDEPTVTEGTGAATWRSVRDGIARTAGIESSTDLVHEVRETGTNIRETRTFTTAASESDPLDVVVAGTTTFELRRPDLHARSAATARITSSADAFRLELQLEIEADGEPFARRRWDERVQRDLL